jgi:single-stranded DNA-binding protein
MADHVVTSLHTGDRVLVTGRLEQRSWEGTDGQHHTRHELVATEVAASLRYAEASITGPPGLPRRGRRPDLSISPTPAGGQPGRRRVYPVALTVTRYQNRYSDELGVASLVMR